MGVSDPPRAEPTSGTERRPPFDGHAVIGTVAVAGGFAALAAICGGLFGAPWPGAVAACGICVMGLVMGGVLILAAGKR